MKMKVNLYLVSIIWVINVEYGYCREIKKRQLYREQVLPHAGGKIPETAFQTDRLALNRLQKEGIAIPDGVILEQRNPQVYQYTHKTMRPVYKVAVTFDNRYTRREGIYPDNEKHTSLETTYIIPHPVLDKSATEFYKKSSIQQPLQKKLTIPSTSSLLQLHQYSNNINNLHNVPYRIASFNHVSEWPSSSVVAHYLPYDWRFFRNDYIASNIYNDFETFFHQFSPKHIDF